MKFKDLIDVLDGNVLLKVYIADSDNIININSIDSAFYLCAAYSNSEVLINYYENKVVKLIMPIFDNEYLLEVFIYR